MLDVVPPRERNGTVLAAGALLPRIRGEVNALVRHLKQHSGRAVRADGERAGDDEVCVGRAGDPPLIAVAAGNVQQR